MTYVGENDRGSNDNSGIITTVISLIIAVINVSDRIIKYVKTKKDEESKRSENQPIELYYNPNTNSYQYKAYDNKLKYVNGGSKMNNNFAYDVYGSLMNPDMPVSDNSRRHMANNYGYDPNKRDYVWTNMTLGQVPSTSEYTPYGGRTMFDPTPFLRQTSSYVRDPYYPYSNEDMSNNWSMPKLNTEFDNDPYAGIIYRNFKNHWTRRTYNPYEPARPFATYDPHSINANDPNHNPFGWSQGVIDGMVNRTNYYKDYILNINRENPFGAPNDIDNPFNTMAGPSYIGPDGRMYTRPMPAEPEEHVTRNFLRRDVPWMSKGPEWFGWNPYGFGLSVFNSDGTPNYYNTNSNGGSFVNVMSNTRSQVMPGDTLAQPLGSDPYVSKYWQDIENARTSYTRPMSNINLNEAVFSKCQTIQSDPNKMNPNMFTNPYSSAVQNHIDRSQLVINPQTGMDINNFSPNQPLAHDSNPTIDALLNITPQQASAISQGAPMPGTQNMPMYQQYQPQMTPNYNYSNYNYQNNYPNYQNSYPNYSQPQYNYGYSQNQDINNYGGMQQSCLGPNVYAGIPGNDMVMRQKFNAYNAQVNYQAPYQSASYGNDYGMNQGYNDRRQSMFVDNYKYDSPNYRSSTYNPNYGMNPQPQQPQPQQNGENPNYGMYQPVNNNVSTSDIYNNATTTESSFSFSHSSPEVQRAAMEADMKTKGLNEMMAQAFCSVAAGEEPPQFTMPENQMSQNETNKSVFGINFGSDEA